MRYFAKIHNNIVQKVVCDTDANWYIDNTDGDWVETFIGTDKKFAEIGDTYDSNLNNFYVISSN